MKTIAANIKNEIVIKNSRFIALLIKIDSSDIETILETIKKQYLKATHYCYAYIYNGKMRSSDDGEPGGTAGLPILNVLEKENLNKVLCVVVRYFGGIKLGAGGLVRAYTKAVTEALKLTDFVYLRKGYKISISFNYSQEKKLNYLLKDELILEKNFSEKVNYIVLVKDETIDKLEEYNFVILEETYIEE